jgi:hypothetical protein
MHELIALLKLVLCIGKCADDEPEWNYFRRKTTRIQTYLKSFKGKLAMIEKLLTSLTRVRKKELCPFLTSHRQKLKGQDFFRTATSQK